MPLDRNYRSPSRWKAQTPTSPTQVTMPKRKNKRSDPMLVYKDLLFKPSEPVMTERELDIYRNYRRGLAQCVEGACECYCNCHTGDFCPIERHGQVTRQHTKNHKPQHVLVKSDQSDPKCPWAGTNHHHIVTCHDTSDEPNKWHFRKINTVHKGSHRD